MSARFINIDRETRMMVSLLAYCYATPSEIMRHRLATPAGKAICKLRKQTGSPVAEKSIFAAPA